MEESPYRTWDEFTKHQIRRNNTFQLCIDELEGDLYYDDSPEKTDDEQELNFDY